MAANSLSETGSNVFAIPADMRSLEGSESFVEAAAERLGGVDILINNAGVSAFGAFIDLPDDAFVDAINKAKPSGAKGSYIKKVALTSTMGPGVKVDLSTLSAPAGA